MMRFYESGTGFPLIFIHGFPFNHMLWDKALSGLDKTYRVITMDLPGISAEAIESELSMRQMAGMLKVYLETSHIHQCIIFGHSMGGYLGAECLAAFPEKIAGLSFVHSLATSDDDDKKSQRDKIIAFLSKGENEKMSFLKTMIPNLFSGKTKDDCQEDIQKILDSCSGYPAGNILELYRSIRNRADHTETIKKTQTPVQWIIGEDDQATPMRAALEQSHLAKINMVDILQNCGHMSMIEKPAELNRYISNFCRFVIK